MILSDNTPKYFITDNYIGPRRQAKGMYQDLIFYSHKNYPQSVFNNSILYKNNVLTPYRFLLKIITSREVLIYELFNLFILLFPILFVYSIKLHRRNCEFSGWYWYTGDLANNTLITCILNIKSLVFIGAMYQNDHRQMINMGVGHHFSRCNFSHISFSVYY